MLSAQLLFLLLLSTDIRTAYDAYNSDYFAVNLYYYKPKQLAHLKIITGVSIASSLLLIISTSKFTRTY
jgi:hypothetical protein